MHFSQPCMVKRRGSFRPTAVAARVCDGVACVEPYTEMFGRHRRRAATPSPSPSGPAVESVG